jgi:hypothetical protein
MYIDFFYILDIDKGQLRKRKAKHLKKKNNLQFLHCLKEGIRQRRISQTYEP